MLLLLFSVLSFWAKVAAGVAAEGLTPLEFLMGPNEELTKEIPLVFRPEDGLRMRESYANKYGFRGERLIALLGGRSPGMLPLAIYDASMLDKKNLEVTSKVPPSKVSPVKRKKAKQPNENRRPTSTESLSALKENSVFSTLSRHNQLLSNDGKDISDNAYYKRLYAAMYNHVGKVLSTTTPAVPYLIIKEPAEEKTFVNEPSILVNSYSYD